MSAFKTSHIEISENSQFRRPSGVTQECNVFIKKFQKKISENQGSGTAAKNEIVPH